jgi:LysM repeat protein
MAPKIQFDFSPRTRILVIVGGVVILGAAVGLIVLLVGGGGPAEPVAEATPGATDTPTPSPSPPPSPTGPPTDTPTPELTATLEPYAHTVQAGETLFYIIQLYGYRDTSVVAEILLLNGMVSENDVFAGQVLLIPRQTPTPGPTAPLPATGEAVGEGEGTGVVATEDGGGAGAAPDYAGCGLENRCVSPDGQYWMHEVVEGDTIAGLAFAYYSRVDAILQANDLPPDPLISIGQLIRVPILVTSTPTLTPTGGPDSTATPTPTVSPPSLLAPANDSTVPRSQRVSLQWVAIQPLAGDQYYLVIVRNTATDEEF